jgi:toxin-antitoxin system PIN domain toxin
MILADANVLLIAVNEDAPEHAAASHALAQEFSRPGGVGFAWVALTAFLRLSTRSGIYPTPLTTAEACAVVDHWLSQPGSRVLQETSRHGERLAGLLRAVGTGGNLTTDAHLAALALEHDATILSFDRDFARFPGVKWRNPGALGSTPPLVHDRP